MRPAGGGGVLVAHGKIALPHFAVRPRHSEFCSAQVKRSNRTASSSLNSAPVIVRRARRRLRRACGESAASDATSAQTRGTEADWE